MKSRQSSPYEAWGIAAALPGLQLAIDQLQDLLRRMKAAAEALSGGAIRETEAAAEGLAIPQQKRPHSYWDSMTPEERSEEMQRRFAVGRGKQKSGASMTPEERKKEMARRARVSAKRGGLMVGRKGVNVKKEAAKRIPQNRGGAASPRHPSNPNHPGHAAWTEKMRGVNQKMWAAKKQAELRGEANAAESMRRTA